SHELRTVPGTGPIFDVHGAVTEISIPCHACGHPLLVREGAAGARLRCACGWETEVPDLAELRKQAGLPPREARPAELIAHLVNTGQLPEGETCAGCGQETNEAVETVAQCENLWAHTRNDSSLGWAILVHWPLFVFMRESEERILNHGLMVPVPLRLCKECQVPLGPSKLLWTAGLLKLLCGISGVLVVFFIPLVGAVLLSVALLGWGTERMIQRRRQAS